MAQKKKKNLLVFRCPDEWTRHALKRELYKRTIATWGVSAQMEMAVEEAAELIHAIQRYKREGSSEKMQAIAEEVADVEIMIGQLREMLGDQKIDEAKAFKLARLEGRLDAYDAKKVREENVVIPGGQSASKLYDLYDRFYQNRTITEFNTAHGKQLEATFKITEDEYDAITKGDEVLLNGVMWKLYKKGLFFPKGTKLTFTDR